MDARQIPRYETKIEQLMGAYQPNTTLGPTIFADWGDRVNITVTNNLRTNG